MPSTSPKPKPASGPRAAHPASGREPSAPSASSKPRTPVKPVKPVDPHRLIRREDGYVSADGRFEVSGAPGSYYLADAARPSPFGLLTIDGPYRTLTELRAAVAAAVEDGGTRG